MTMSRLPPRVLVADDQPDVLVALKLLLKSEGYSTEAVESPDAIVKAVEDQDFDLLLMDLNYARDTTSGREGLDLLRRLKDVDDTLPIVVMTAWGSVELTVEAMRAGARDFVQKPWDNARLLSILRTQGTCLTGSSGNSFGFWRRGSSSGSAPPKPSAPTSASSPPPMPISARKSPRDASARICCSASIPSRFTSRRFATAGATSSLWRSIF